MSEEEFKNIYDELKQDSKYQKYCYIIDFKDNKIKTLQQRIDKAINDLEIIIDIIKEQPTSNDNWILERLESNKSILKGGKYESEK